MKIFKKQIRRQRNLGILQKYGVLVVALLTWPGVAGAQQWVTVTTPQFPVGTAL